MSHKVPQIEAESAAEDDLQMVLEVLRKKFFHGRIGEGVIHIPLLHDTALASYGLVRWSAHQSERRSERALDLRQEDMRCREMVILKESQESGLDEVKPFGVKCWRVLEDSDQSGEVNTTLLHELLPSPHEQVETHFQQLTKVHCKPSVKVVFNRASFRNELSRTDCRDADSSKQGSRCQAVEQTLAWRHRPCLRC